MSEKLKQDHLVSPGEVVRQKLEDKGWTQGDFAKIIGRPVQAINEIISGKKSITPETAILFAEAFGNSAEEWLNLEVSYRLSTLSPEQHKVDLVSRRVKLYSTAPIKELVKRGWIKNASNIEELEAEVLSFLGISDLNSTPQVVANFRRSNAKAIDTPSIVAWVRKAEIDSKKMPCSKFRPQKLKQSISKLISLSTEEHKMRQVPQQLRHLGVRLVFIPHLPKTRIDGAAFWLDKNSPVVALSLRINRIDNFWFTLMHEIAHILTGYQNATAYLDNDLDNDSQNETEALANQTARDWLIPPESFNAFVEDNNPFFSRRVVLEFADKLSIHSAIIVGRLQYEKLIPYTNLRNLLGKIRPIFAGVA